MCQIWLSREPGWDSAWLYPLGGRTEEVARADKSDTTITTSFERFHGLAEKGASKQGLICSQILSSHIDSLN